MPNIIKTEAVDTEHGRFTITLTKTKKEYVFRVLNPVGETAKNELAYPIATPFMDILQILLELKKAMKEKPFFPNSN